MNKIGIIIADDAEFEPFLGLPGASVRDFYSCRGICFEYNKNKISAVHSGVGKVNAAAAAAHLISDEKPDFILNAGFSGVVSGLRRGDFAAGKSYVECDFDITATGRRPGEKPGQTYIYKADERLLRAALSIEGVKSAALGTGDIFLTDKEKKEFYKKTFGINAFDMESAAIASVCFFAGVPFLSLRKISDDADDAALEDFREMSGKHEPDIMEILLKIIDSLL